MTEGDQRKTAGLQSASSRWSCLMLVRAGEQYWKQKAPFFWFLQKTLQKQFFFQKKQPKSFWLLQKMGLSLPPACAGTSGCMEVCASHRTLHEQIPPHAASRLPHVPRTRIYSSPTCASHPTALFPRHSGSACASRTRARLLLSALPSPPRCR